MKSNLPNHGVKGPWRYSSTYLFAPLLTSPTWKSWDSLHSHTDPHLCISCFLSCNIPHQSPLTSPYTYMINIFASHFKGCLLSKTSLTASGHHKWLIKIVSQPASYVYSHIVWQLFICVSVSHVDYMLLIGRGLYFSPLWMAFNK